MINTELQTAGRIFRFFLPSFTPAVFKIANRMSRFLSGFHSFGLQYEQKYITRADGTMLRICVYYPREKRDGVPGLLWLHGGGYALGVPEQDESFIKRFVEASGCVVVAPDYTLSLQKPYPAALEDSYAALLWLRDNGAQYGMRSDQIFVGGESAGGGLTAALSLYARDKAEVAIAFQMPLYPMLDDRPTESSANNDAPVWNTTSNNLAWQLYLGDAYGTDDVPIYAAPARAADYSGLPPACTYVGSIEPFFAETQTYVEKLRNSGVSVDFKVFDGAFHGFDIICPNTKIAKDARSFLMDCFKYAVENYFAEQPAGV